MSDSRQSTRGAGFVLLGLVLGGIGFCLGQENLPTKVDQATTRSEPNNRVRFSLCSVPPDDDQRAYAIVADNFTGEVRVIYGVWIDNNETVASLNKILDLPPSKDPHQGKTLRYYAAKPGESPWK